MSEISDICQNLKSKEVLPDVIRLFDLKIDQFKGSLWSEKDKDKVYEIRNNVVLLESLKREIVLKSQQNDTEE